MNDKIKLYSDPDLIEWKTFEGWIQGKYRTSYDYET